MARNVDDGDNNDDDDNVGKKEANDNDARDIVTHLSSISSVLVELKVSLNAYKTFSVIAPDAALKSFVFCESVLYSSYPTIY